MMKSMVALSLIIGSGNVYAMSVENAQKLITANQNLFNAVTSQIAVTKTMIDSYKQKLATTTNPQLIASYKTVIASLETSLATAYKNLDKSIAGLESAKKELALATGTATAAPAPVVLGPGDANIITVKPVVPTVSSVEYVNSKEHSIIHTEAAWAQGYTGKGVTVAVLDSGFSHLNTDVNKLYSAPQNVIDFANIYNPTTKMYTKTQLSGGMIADVKMGSTNLSGLTSVPTVTINGNGTGAKAVAIVTNGVLTGIAITDPGTGYSGTVTATLKNGATGATIGTLTAQVAGYDYLGHGTSVASVISGSFNNKGVVGVAFDANLIGVKIANVDGGIALADAVDGARAAYKQGATIINQSLGTYSAIPSSYQTAYKDLVKAGVTFVTAAGNEGKSCLTVGECNQLAVMPSLSGNGEMLTSAGSWIVVGALDSTGNALASYSNKAGITKNYFITAPGTNIGVANYSSDTVTTKSGTSFAAPVVAGSMALLQQKWPRLSGNQQSQILFKTADDLGAAGVDDVYGWGRLNLERAFSPVGDVLVPSLVANVAGLNSVKTPTAWTTSITGQSLVTMKLKGFESLDNVVGFDSFQRDYTLSLTSSVNPTSDNFSFDQFLMMPVSKSWRIGVSNTHDAVAVGYKYGNATYTYSYIDGLIGTSGTGALAYDGKTHYFGVNYNNFDGDYTGFDVSAMYGYGVARNDSSSILQMSNMQVASARAKALYNGFGAMVDVPSVVVNGKASLTRAVSSDIDGNIQYANDTLDMSKGAFEKTVALVYQNANLLAQVGRTFDRYGIEGLQSTDVKISGQWYW